MKALRMLSCLLMVLLSIWATLITLNAAIYWRALGDQREGICWMLMLICLMSASLFGYATRKW